VEGKSEEAKTSNTRNVLTRLIAHLRRKEIHEARTFSLAGES